MHDHGLGERIHGWDDLLLDEEGIDEALDMALEVVRRTFGGGPDVSLTVRARDGRGPHTRAATDERARRLDEWQYVNGEGPCVTADKQRAICAVDDLTDDDTFPGFASVALDMDVHGVASFPLLVRDQAIGSLNLFFDQLGRLDTEMVDLGRQLAATLSPMLANFLTHERSLELTSQLEEALAGRSVIERAKGLMMARLGIGADRAFELLSTQSQHENRKVREVARTIVERHERAVAATDEEAG